MAAQGTEDPMWSHKSTRVIDCTEVNTHSGTLTLGAWNTGETYKGQCPEQGSEAQSCAFGGLGNEESSL